MASRRYIDGALIKRYIDRAVRREIRRIVFRDALIADIRTLVDLVKDNESLYKVHIPLRTLYMMFASPKPVDPQTLYKNRAHYAQLVLNELNRAPNFPGKNKALSIAKNVLSGIKTDYDNHVLSGSKIPTSGDNPYRQGDYKQSQLSYNVPYEKKEVPQRPLTGGSFKVRKK